MGREWVRASVSEHPPIVDALLAHPAHEPFMRRVLTSPLRLDAEGMEARCAAETVRILGVIDNGLALIAAIRSLETDAVPGAREHGLEPGPVGLQGEVDGHHIRVAPQVIRVSLRTPLPITLSRGGDPVTVRDMVLSGRVFSRSPGPDLTDRIGNDVVRGPLLSMLYEEPGRVHIGPDTIEVFRRDGLLHDVGTILPRALELARALG